MKKYFLQWIPVDDPIILGSYFIANDGKVTKATVDADYHQWLRRVKLFLCGDVEVGDTDFYSEPSAIESYNRGLRFELVSVEDLEGYKSATIKYLQNPTKPSSVGNEREWPYENLWKKIGEVSEDHESEAGHTFTEDQVGFVICEPWEDPQNVTYEEWVRNEHGFHKTIELQCTKCKHFH